MPEEKETKHKRWRAMLEFDRARPFIKAGMVFLMQLKWGSKPQDFNAHAERALDKVTEELKADTEPDKYSLEY